MDRGRFWSELYIGLIASHSCPHSFVTLLRYCELLQGPVEVSYVLGIMAVLVFLGMTSVHRLSHVGVSDFKLLVTGLLANTIGYIMLYFLWHRK